MKKFLSVLCVFTILAMTSSVMANPGMPNGRGGDFHHHGMRIEHQMPPHGPGPHHFAPMHCGGSIAIGLGSFYTYPSDFYYDYPYYRRCCGCVGYRTGLHSGIYIGF